MKTSTKILLFIGSALGIGAIGYFIYKKMKPTDDSSSKKLSQKDKESVKLEITDTDWVNRSVSFKVLLNGKTYMSEKINWENKYMGSEFGFVGSPLYSPQNQIEIVGANLTNGLILVVKLNGENVSGKMINFAAKKITDYDGDNLAEDISKAKEISKEISKNLISMSFFNGESSADGADTPAPNPYNYTQKWIYIIENGKDYCRWFDSKGRNTVTYERPCTLAQSNMYSKEGSYYKKKKKKLFS
jgi:hypothetical protein